MSTYGRNFGFRVAPQSENRSGRFSSPLAGTIPIGAPVVADLAAGLDPMGNQIVKLAPSGAGLPNLGGVAVYEYAAAAFAGLDPLLATYSDLGTVPPGRALQVVNGNLVKLWLANTVSSVFLGARTYPGRTMVSGIGASPTVIIGDFLIPFTGDDVNGYWQSTGTAAGAWAVITNVDTVRAEVEARMLF